MFPSPVAYFVDMSQGGMMIIFAVKVFGVSESIIEAFRHQDLHCCGCSSFSIAPVLRITLYHVLPYYKSISLFFFEFLGSLE